MTHLVKSAFPFNDDAVIGFAQQALDRANELARAQLDFAERAFREVFADCSALIGQREPSAIVEAWPKVVESIIRTSTEGSVAALKGNLEFSREMIQIVRHQLPEASRQIVARALEPIAAASLAANELAQQAPGRASNDRPAAHRAKKAA